MVFTKQFTTKESAYLERINFLESQLANYDKVDLTMLNKQNKEYESQISHLNTSIDSMNNKHNEEKHRYNNFVSEVMQIKKKLIDEVKNLEVIKKEIMTQTNNNKQNVEFVIKQNDSLDAIMSMDNLNNENKISQARSNVKITEVKDSSSLIGTPEKLKTFYETELDDGDDIYNNRNKYVSSMEFSQSLSRSKSPDGKALNGNRKAASQAELLNDNRSELNLPRDLRGDVGKKGNRNYSAEKRYGPHRDTLSSPTIMVRK